MDYQANLTKHLQVIGGKRLDAINLACEMMMFSFGEYELHAQCLTRIIRENDVLVTTLDYQSWDGETEENNDEWFFVEQNRDKIVGGMGVIENDFHDRKDLTPNVCAVYTEESHRKMGIAGVLLNMVVDDLKSKGISPVYLVTDHTGFYERYGWEFYCMAQGDGEPDMTRLYIHR